MSKNIFVAVSKNRQDQVKYFIEEKKVPVTTSNLVGQTIAHVAAFNGNLNILKYILKIDPLLVTYTDRWNQTPLHMAVENGTLEVVEYLVDECDADIKACSNLYHTTGVLHIAAEKGHLPVFKYFVERKNMDVNQRNDAGQPPAFFAANFDRVNVIKYIAEETKANLTMIDNEKRNILHMTVQDGGLKVPKYLLDEKKLPIDINWEDNLGRTVVHFACRFGYMDYLKYFVEEKHANVNLPDHMGWTSLHQVTFMGNMEFIKYLVEHGADLTAKDFHGKTAIDTASNKEVIAYLEVAKHKRTQKGPRIRRNALNPSDVAEAQSSPEICQRIRGSINVETVASGRLEGAGGSKMGEIAASVSGLLLLANVCMRYSGSWVSSETVTVKEFLLSPREILENKMDKVAVDVINSVFSN